MPWGWRPNGYDPVPMGRRVGWIDGTDLYLDRDAAHVVVQKLAAEGGEALPVSAATLAKRMNEKKLLASTEQGARGSLTVRRTLGGTRRSVLHLHATALTPTADPPAGQPEPTNPTTPTLHPTSAPSRPQGADDPRGQVGQSGQHEKETPTDAADGPTPHHTEHRSPTPGPDQPDQTDQTDQTDPCPYPEHRDRDWTSTYGIRTCGVCHPPATPDVVARDAPGTTGETP